MSHARTLISLFICKEAKRGASAWTAQPRRRYRLGRKGLSGLACLLCLLLSACSLYTVRPLNASSSSGGGGGGGGAQPFDPERYVNQIWASRVVPTVVAQAHDASEVLAALKANQQAA
uniref:DUF2291 family protein n=1 Tax=Thermogemmatispora sp. TaxID=1968838 RepID=UPI0035E4360B